MRELLNEIDWHHNLTPLSILEAWEFFTAHFNDILHQCVPLIKQRKKKNIYMSSNALRLKNRKNKLWKNYLISKSSDDFHRFCKVRNDLRTLTRTLRSDYERNLSLNVKHNPKAFWKYINSRLKVRPTIDDLQCPDGSTAHTDKDKAEALNNFFTSIFTQENLSSIPSFTLDTTVPLLQLVTVSPHIVYKRLLDINPGKSPGPEGWPLIALRETAEQICIPLSILFTQSLETGLLPQDWKSAHVTPIFKKGNRHLPNNYRPISLTSSIVRLMESIIKDEIYDHLNSNHLLSVNQHGFMPGRSCTTQLLIAMDYWTKALEQRIPVDIIYLDFKKAFDSVPHTRLLSKLQAYGIGGKLYNWLYNYFTGRKQKVVLNNESSSWTSVTSGVPQGSVLGPLLFSIFINDLPSVVQSELVLFADDAKIYRTIQSDDDYLQLQQDLDNLFLWSCEWQLCFNVDKCKVLHIGSNQHYRQYRLGGDFITVSDAEKDLGILIDNKLAFHKQCSTAVNKANKLLGIIRRSFEYINADTMLCLYKSLIRPIIEYGNVIWGPHYVIDQQAIEKIQHRATKLIPELRHDSYQERLSKLSLPSLVYRRQRGDLIFLYQLINQHFNIDINDFFRYQTYTTTRGHNYKIYKPHAKRFCRVNFFTLRTINNWNSLPASVVESATVNSFKNSLDSFWSYKHYISD